MNGFTLLPGDFRCPVCRGTRYGTSFLRIPAAPYQAVLYRCASCQFGFTDRDQFVSDEKKGSESSSAKSASR